MTDERRYRDEEIAQIFEAAAEPRTPTRRAPYTTDGLTLAELQEIGREVGMPPERIADAASLIDRQRTAAPRRTDLGMPIAVGRTVDLPRAPTDREWGLLVAELRETFNARGREESRGDLRSWSNGNLRALVEPTETGYRLRLGTLKGEAVAVNRAGIAGILLGLMLLVLSRFTPGGGFDDLWLPAFLGSLALGYNALRLPRWASEREQQMDHIADRARALIGTDTG